MDCSCNNAGSPICPNCGRHSNSPHNTFIHLGVDTGRIGELQMLPELEEFKFGEEVKAEITMLFQTATQGSTKRNKPRRAIIFCCIVNVCKRHGVVFDQNDLKERLGITDRNINTAMKEIGHLLGKTSPAITIEDVIKNIMKLFDLRVELFDPIMAIYYNCKRISVRFNAAKPETIASGLVYYYLMRHLQDFNQDDYFDRSNVTKDTIIAVYDEIKSILKD